MSSNELDADEDWKPPRRERRERPDDDGFIDVELARRAVAAPAVALLVGWCFLSLIALAFLAIAVWTLAVPEALSPGAKKEQPIMLALGFGYPLATAVGLYGAWRMRQLRAYPWAMASAILMMLALSCGFIGIVLGIWALTALNRPEVRRAFRSKTH
ncbi:hypothetical protein VT84_20580 [Gemmata sp. SH-PL17]|uniref:hypothetical protein n=1 Tax=Gemmata sp. SH-PL17 TaxID=1630693 RepID=UPI0004AF0422|nr:hypothetical protein [Gemmata sp. SH-PL17]AMV26808.1 hypothetical protein VT84_20580 [Gemmata sp. SH-PL17]